MTILVLLLTTAAVAVPDFAIASFAVAILFAVGGLVLGILAPPPDVLTRDATGS